MSETHLPSSSRRALGAGRKRRMLAIVAASLAVVLSGCSIQIKSEPDPSIPQDTMLLAADKGNPLFERIFNPNLINKRTASSYIYEPLTVTNVLDGSQTPWLAEAVTLPDAHTVDYTIRDGVTWSDGKKFTPADVVFTFNLLKEFPTLDMKGIWQHIDRLEVAGQHVIVHLTDDDSTASAIISQTMILPEHIWKDIDAPDMYRDEDPIGTGPYTLGNFTSQQYTMDKNENYWQADAVEIKHLVLPSATGELDLVTKGFDWAYSYMSNVEGTWLAGNENNKYWFPPGGVISLVPNLDKAPFDNIDLRRGIALALDRDRIAAAATEEYMTAAGQTGLMLPNQQAQLDPSIPNDGIITQDVDAAIEAFAAAGYTRSGDAMVDSSGTQLSFSITTANGYADWLRAVQEVRKQLGAIGIEVTIKAPQPAGYQLAIANGDFEMAMGGMGGGNLFQGYNSLLSSEFYQENGTQTTSNYQRFSSPEVDSILAAYKKTTDVGEQTQLNYRLQRIVYDELPVIGLYYGGLWGLYNTGKFTGWPSADDPYAPPQTYDSSTLLILTRLKLAENGAN
ncbi:ABC transporter substrate-binding protein [Leifsonia sp. A12D58]|uniref:ABC transporter substrate-binding protein n=1 Tax=Leifsonia sp. A12D58 TaxID=3397674 RepID=UPI0039E0EB7E